MRPERVSNILSEYKESLDRCYMADAVFILKPAHTCNQITNTENGDFTCTKCGHGLHLKILKNRYTRKTEEQMCTANGERNQKALPIGATHPKATSLHIQAITLPVVAAPAPPPDPDPGLDISPWRITSV